MVTELLIESTFNPHPAPDTMPADRWGWVKPTALARGLLRDRWLTRVGSPGGETGQRGQLCMKEIWPLI